MIYIGICDDEKIYRQNIHMHCCNYFNQKGINCSFVFFASSNEVLSYTENELSVLLLDIEMNENINGIHIMQMVQKNSNIRTIIFVSSYTEYVFDSFSPKTIGFCPKPIETARLNRLLSQALVHAGKKPIVFSSSPDDVFYEDDILYIRSEGHYIHVYTLNDTHLYVLDIKQAEELLTDTNLVRIHKSYIANLAYIKDINSTEITLVTPDGIKKQLNLSRLYSKKVRAAYMEYIKLR